MIKFLNKFFNIFKSLSWWLFLVFIFFMDFGALLLTILLVENPAHSDSMGLLLGILIGITFFIVLPLVLLFVIGALLTYSIIFKLHGKTFKEFSSLCFKCFKKAFLGICKNKWQLSFAILQLICFSIVLSWFLGGYEWLLHMIHGKP